MSMMGDAVMVRLCDRRLAQAAQHYYLVPLSSSRLFIFLSCSHPLHVYTEIAVVYLCVVWGRSYLPLWLAGMAMLPVG